jgi:predicted GNAT family N-acyltransferase
MLVEWGIEEADSLNLPCYLEASEFGRPLYERFGFKIVQTNYLDMNKYNIPDAQGIERNDIMWRDAKQK